MITRCQNLNFFKLNFCRTQVLFMGPLIPLLWTSGDVCPGFQSQGGFPCLHASSPAHNGFLRFTSGATPAFSTNSGVHCIRHGWLFLSDLSDLLVEKNPIGPSPPLSSVTSSALSFAIKLMIYFKTIKSLSISQMSLST